MESLSSETSDSSSEEGPSSVESQTSETSSSELSSDSSEETSSSESTTEESSEESSSAEEDPFNGYYRSINFSWTGASLKTALAEKISTATIDKGYDYAYTAYQTTDIDENGKIIDVYSDFHYDPVADHQGAPGKGNYSKEGQMYNREHTIPQSVFSEHAPMKSDLHHLLPTDGYVNNRRSNYPHGYVSSAKYTSTNNTIIGTSDSTKNHGYSADNVCEVPDEYKGDIARIYFYMVTRYESKLTSWKTFDSFSKNTYPSLAKWAVETYLEWNDLDPVSEKEITRNEEVYKIQNNRNPFIDHPEAAHAIWDSAYSD